jgi:hypothetical protein
MIKKLRILFLFFSIAIKANAQDTAVYDHLFRFLYENDFINVLGKGTDNQYTGGMRIDLFSTKKQPSRSILDKWMRRAGDEAINTYGWSIMQVAFTPDNLSKTEPDVSDYPYSGGLFLIHTLHSTDPVKKYTIQTELIGGIIGHCSYADQTQEGIHRWIHYQLPKGWNYQMPTDILLNVNMTVEKMIVQSGRWLELSGGANARIGTMVDGANIYGLLRIGKMVPYYNGYVSQYGSPRQNRPHRSQVYLVAKPGLSWTGYNAFVDGGVFAGKSAYYRVAENEKMPYTTDKNIHPFGDAGIVFVSGKISASITQRIMPTLLTNYQPHAVGNISFTVSW